MFDDKAVKRAILENDRKATYHSIAQSAVDDDRGGRFAFSDSKATVTGSSPIAYPQQPPTSPWHSDPCPPEPPLGYSIEDQEPVGEVFEQQAAAEASAKPTAHGGGRHRGFRRI